MRGTAESTNESPRKPRHLIDSEVHAEPIDPGDAEDEFINVECNQALRLIDRFKLARLRLKTENETGMQVGVQGIAALHPRANLRSREPSKAPSDFHVRIV
ncbi:hypothetical protein FVEG_09794 [Fusarium verticillioides 7600]|uniref:Uncharacterized protein n=1 Tax=Gibberella moniliformis (strain M3125 / FGSC 7600) TaxID=334819 RepID=W7N1M7_GIBM7|nr:hypothetical protein FVEG_09794 [Fusarium verticillioides 7600]EWG50637.1 hypothetical protein FVEG_09794 [Fusarium verticillioides 7600]